jgi:2-oxoglutarate ferredoxin oxidoreductase subunit gamma
MSRTEVRISGFGGQGVALLGHMLANATMLDGKEAAQVETYAMQQRGGAVRSDVVVSEQEIDYPEITAADVIVAMSQEALDKNINYLKDGGILIIDPLYVNTEKLEKRTEHVYRIRATEIAKNELKNGMVVNVVMLGALVGISGLVSEPSLKKAVAEGVPAKTLELNLKALDRGLGEGRNARPI